MRRNCKILRSDVLSIEYITVDRLRYAHISARNALNSSLLIKESLFRQNIRVRCVTNIRASGALSETHAIDAEGNKRKRKTAARDVFHINR